MVQRNKLANVARQPPTEDDTTSFAQLSREQLTRLAALICTGEEPLPLDLPCGQLASLLTEVNRTRRKRLIRLIAQAIAHDMHGERELKEMGE